jgi:hypothetical protein
MKASSLFIALSLFLSSALHLRAQTLGDPFDANAQYVTTLDVSGEISDPFHPEVKGSFHLEIGVARTSGGRIDYLPTLSSLTFSGDGSVINDLTTAQLFDAIDRAVVATGVTKGITACSSSCPGTDTVRVIHDACVHRLGSGTGTYFTPCAPQNWCYRMFTYCCPSGPGAPTVTKIASTPCTCVPDSTGSCDATCN